LKYAFLDFIFKRNARERTFFCIASAGFGTRLATLISTMFAADMLGANFKFIWKFNYANRLHDIPSVKEMFKEEFIEKHHLESPPNDINYKVINRVFSAKDLRKIKTSRHTQIQTLNNPLSDCNIHSEYFKKLPFNNQYLDVINYVNSLPVHKYGIHIRRGDIAYDIYRCGGVFIEKLLPLPVLELLIKKLQPHTPLIIGEFVISDLNNFLKYNLPNTLRYEYPYSENKSLVDFFDLCLIGRCQMIFGGFSKFLECGTLINNCKYTDINYFLSLDEINRVVIDFINKTDITGNKIEISLACDYYVSCNHKILSKNDIYELAKKAFLNDPQNPAYFIKLVSHYLENFGIDYATNFINSTTTLQSIANVLLDISYSHIHDNTNMFNNLTHSKGYLNQNDWKILKRYSGASNWIDFILGLYYYCNTFKYEGLNYLKTSSEVVLDKQLKNKFSRLINLE